MRDTEAFRAGRLAGGPQIIGSRLVLVSGKAYLHSYHKILSQKGRLCVSSICKLDTN